MRQTIILCLLLLSPWAQAVLQAPLNMSSGRSGMAIQTLGATCFTFDLAADTLPCNPAYMAKKRDRDFKAQLFVGNNINYLNDVAKVARGEADQNTIENLFNQKQSSEFEASLEAAYISETFGLSYEPYRVSYYSVFQNRALPEITVFATLEDSARFQVASYTHDDFYVGLQMRYLHRQIVSSRFFLTDVLAENRNQFLDPKDQKFIFVEPGILYSLEKSEWRPEVSFNIVNWSFKSGDDLFSDPIPEYHLGGAFSHEVGYGRWGWAMDAGWNKSIESASEIPTLGSFFEMGILQIFASLAEKSNGAGFTVHFDSFNLGLSYSAKEESFDANTNFYSRRLYFMLGAEI